LAMAVLLLFLVFYTFYPEELYKSKKYLLLS